MIYERYGPPEVLRVVKLPRPKPRPHEVLIRVRAVEVTKGDCELRSFNFPVKWFAGPLRLAWGITEPRRNRRVLGGYFAGEVEACGGGVTRFNVGERVFGGAQLRMGAYANYAVYPETYSIARLPEKVSFEAGAASLLGGLNAWHFLNLGKLERGDQLLVNGAGGSIGLLAIQIAKAKGAVVTAVDKPAKAELIQRAGADHFFDYTMEDIRSAGSSFDVMLNMVPSMSAKTCLGLVKPGGRVLMGNPRLRDLLGGVFRSPGEGKRVHVAFAGETLQDLEALSGLLETGVVRPIIDRTLPLVNVAEAHRLVETEDRQGAIVLVPDG